MPSELLCGFNFCLSILGDSENNIPFQEVSGLSKDFGIEEVVGGGENRFKYRLPTTPSFKNLILKRGVTPDNTELGTWCTSVLGMELSAPILTKDIKLRLLDGDGSISMEWIFYNAYPVKWSGSTLNSVKNEIFVETIELAYNYFELEENFGLDLLFGD